MFKLTYIKKGKGKQRNKNQREQTNNKMTDLNANIAIIMLNINGLNTPIKRQKWSEWIKKKI